jgi:hypothetical protein
MKYCFIILLVLSSFLLNPCYSQEKYVLKFFLNGERQVLDNNYELYLVNNSSKGRIICTPAINNDTFRIPWYYQYESDRGFEFILKYKRHYYWMGGFIFYNNYKYPVQEYEFRLYTKRSCEYIENEQYNYCSSWQNHDTLEGCQTLSSDNLFICKPIFNIKKYYNVSKQLVKSKAHKNDTENMIIDNEYFMGL